MEFEKLQAIVVEVLNVDVNQVKMETTFVDDLGADSLDIFQIVTAIEDEFSIRIKDEDMESITTVGDAINQIQNATH